MFEGQSPDNYEQKCLCVLVVDISGSMAGEPINQLNRGLQDFHKEVLTDFVASQRLEVSMVTFGSTAQCIQEPTLVNNFQMPTLFTNGSTKLVDGVRLAMNLIENRKKWYKETGQNYFRPMIILITDGEPDAEQDVNGLSNEVSSAIGSKKFMFYSLGVRGYNHQKLTQICSTPPPLPLDGYKFSEFFSWLSNSISIITKSTEGETLSLPPISDWTQIQM
ncbi:vWA domain-containing protein [Chitinophaga nivalis]|uniref:VWA domain-containing protein n=1 Tax=Chitinophaga nivalis TaxID=2991709 RepID=A0ABT3IHF7_9BACT|nr:VWA domain-containing protein [Chitinophaga nivalis]MCW3466958.1 VWA domain-containing protein [Chitinophaga nivalis]MCW3483351.1 VWA domain-containing protein [Chitinophaga nivalis]